MDAIVHCHAYNELQFRRGNCGKKKLNTKKSEKKETLFNSYGLIQKAFIYAFIWMNGIERVEMYKTKNTMKIVQLIKFDAN